MEKPRSKSAGPVDRHKEKQQRLAYMREKSEDARSVIQRPRGKHGQMIDLMTEEDRRALNLNKYEQAYTLAELQDKIKRQADQYKPEFKVHFGIFQNKLKEFKENPARKDQDLIDYFKFMAHISAVYQNQLAQFLSNEMLNLLQQYYSIMHAEVRMCLVTCLKIMRGKDVVPAAAVIPVFIKLFKCKDKALREFLHSCIITDLKELNAKSKNHAINKKLQNFILTLLQDPNEDASKRAMNVMVELYKRHIWNDEKTVNTIWQGCEHANPKIVLAACKFFLILDYDYQSESDIDSSDAENAADMLKHHKGSKLTKAKKAYLERAVKAEKRKEARKNRVHIGTDFLPIDTLYDPQSCAERLFSKLKKSNDKYEVKLHMLRLVARLIGRHSLMVLSFYPYILRYLNSHDKEKIGEIFAMIIEACHELVPPEDVKPVIERIITNYVTEYCANQHITIGLNAIREILTRMPLALDPSQIEYLVEFRNHKHKSVMAAAKSLINFFRDVCPQLLPKKYAGRFTVIETKEAPVYGQRSLATTVDGVELLGEGAGVASERMLTDKDLKRIKMKKMRQAIRKVDRHGFRSSSEEESDESQQDEVGDEEEGESEGEQGEDSLSEMGESFEAELSESEIAKAKALQQYEAMHSSDGADDEEMGEDDMDEYSFDEDGESWIEEDGEEEEEEPPKLVPIKPAKKSVGFAPKVDVKEFAEDSSDIRSSELESDSDEDSEESEDNPHGFVFAHNLDTYRKSKKERNESLILEKEAKKGFEHKKRDRKNKNAGSTNEQKKRHKPFNMLLPKRIQEQNLKRDEIRGKLKRKDGSKIKQLGHWNKNTQQKIESKKRTMGVR